MSSRMLGRLLLVPLVLAATALFGVVPASAATFTVTKTADTADGTCSATDCSLREAIIAANAAAGADTILVPAGTYVRSIAGTGEDAAANGDLDVTGDTTITGAGAAFTIIQGNGTASGERVFEVLGAEVSISDVTVRNGFGASPGDDGGGLRVTSLGELTVTRSIVTGNHADDFGGGLNSDSDGILRVENTVVAGNDADDEGGGLGLDGDSTLTNVTVSNNTADTEGGGAWSFMAATLTNVTMSANTTPGDGGGFFNSSGADTLNNVTIAVNTSDSNNDGDNGGGIYNDGDPLEIRNSIVANNIDVSGGSPDCFTDPTPLTSQGHNLVEDTSGCSGVTGTGDITGQDPNLGPLADNGGFSSTHALLAGSPAINKGDPAPPGSGGTACAGTDQRGVPRSACDIGAYELVACKGAVINRLGTEGNDTLVGTPGPDGFLAFGGNDTVRGLGGPDTLCLGPGKDVGAGGGGKDREFGEGGKDRLKGQGGNDRLVGGPGKDTCIGGPGRRDRARQCEVKKSVP